MSGEINKKDTYAVYHLTDNGIEPKLIAKELGIGIKLVKDIISSRPKSQNDQIKTTSSKVTTNSKDMMIRETSAKRNKSVAIMTKEASQVNDSFRKNLSDSRDSRTSRNAIYRPNDHK